LVIGPLGIVQVHSELTYDVLDMAFPVNFCLFASVMKLLILIFVLYPTPSFGLGEFVVPVIAMEYPDVGSKWVIFYDRVVLYYHENFHAVA